MVFPEVDGEVRIEAEVVNQKFDRFMVKDYVKSVKNTDFPIYIETPVTQEELDSYIEDFMRRRGDALYRRNRSQGIRELEEIRGNNERVAAFRFPARCASRAESKLLPASYDTGTVGFICVHSQRRHRTFLHR